MSHYNNKKELLLQSQEEVTELRLLVQQKEEELQAAAARSQLLQLEVEQVRSSEKKLLGSVASLEAQVSRSSVSRFSRPPEASRTSRRVTAPSSCSCCSSLSWPSPTVTCELTPGSSWANGRPLCRPTSSCLMGAPASWPCSGRRRRRASAATAWTTARWRTRPAPRGERVTQLFFF